MTAVFSRRGVLGAGLVVASAGLVTGAASASAATAPASVSSSESVVDPLLPVRSQFAGRIGVEYAAASERSIHRLVLSEVEDLPGGGDAENRFAVTFATDDGARDGTYRLSIDGAHVATLFCARVSDAPRLQAIIDRSGGAS